MYPVPDWTIEIHNEARAMFAEKRVADLEDALIECMIPLEVLRGQEDRHWLVSRSPEMREQIVKATDAARAALDVRKP